MDVMFSSKSNEWATPSALYEQLNALFGPFTLDPCSTEENHKCRTFYTIEQNGLDQDWGGHTVFMNPPYGRCIAAWIKKAHEESLKQGTKVIALIPARTDTRYWHEYVMKARAIYFIKGRVKFGDSENTAPFPSAVVYFDGQHYPSMGVISQK